MPTEDTYARFKVCPTCRGEGGSSAYLGSFDGDAWDEMDEEWKDDYRSGKFDKTCTRCQGKRVVVQEGREHEVSTA